MNTTDIDPVALSTEKRCTSHLFLRGKSIPEKELSSSSPLRIPDTPEYPPTIRFDAVYASAVLQHFGTQQLKDEVIATWKDSFYPGGIVTAADTEQAEIDDERAVAKEKKQKQDQDSHEARDLPDTFDTLMTLPYIMVPKNELQATLREAREKAEAAEQKRVREKVDAWLRQV
jgi:hypothetical protein